MQWKKLRVKDIAYMPIEREELDKIIATDEQWLEDHPTKIMRSAGKAVQS